MRPFPVSRGAHCETEDKKRSGAKDEMGKNMQNKHTLECSNTVFSMNQLGIETDLQGARMPHCHPYSSIVTMS